MNPPGEVLDAASACTRSKAIFPFLLVEVAVLLLLTYMPGLTLWLPRVLMGYGIR